MILDAESLALANAIEALLEERRRRRTTSSPSCMESVLEIATTPRPDTREAGDELRELRREVAEAAARRGPRDRLRRHAPVRDVGGPARSRRGRATAS